MKRILFGLALSVLIGSVGGVLHASAEKWYPAQKYATQTPIYFSLVDSNSPWRVYETAPAAADVHVFQDGVSEARATNAVTDLGRTFSLVLTAAEMTGNIITVDVNDASAPPLFGDLVIYIPTYGHASATYPVDWSDSTPPVDVASMQAGTVTAAAVAAGAFDADALATDAISEIFNTSLQTYKTKRTAAWWWQQVKGGEPVDIQVGQTAQAGGTVNTIVLDPTSSATDNAYRNQLVELLTNTGAPATRTIVSYNGTTKTATVGENWPGSSPDATTTYTLWAAPSSELAHEGLAQTGGVTSITLAADAPSTSSITGWIKLRSGTGSPDTQEIVSYNGATKVLTVTAWTGASPDGTTYYALVPFGGIASDTTTTTPTLSISDIQTAMTAQGATTTVFTNLATVDTIAELIAGLKLGDPNSAADTLVGDILVLEAMVDSLEVSIANGTYGLSALQVILAAVETDTAAMDTASELRTLLVGADIELATEPNLTAVLADTAAMDTANELRTLLTGTTTALSILTIADVNTASGTWGVALDADTLALLNKIYFNLP